MSVIQISKIQLRRGQELQTGIPQLDPGELGWAQDTEHLYIGKRIEEGAADDNNSRILTDVDLTNIFAAIGHTSTGTVNTGTVEGPTGPTGPRGPTGVTGASGPIGPSGAAGSSSGGSGNGTYQYRSDVSYITDTAPRSIQAKLDDTVSLADYAVTAGSTPVDITAKFKLAVADLFLNSSNGTFQRSDARRQLLIPAGNFIISDVINLPPYTSLIGAGTDLTMLTLTSINTSMFRTADTNNNTFESGNMQTGTNSAQNIHISEMTMHHSTDTESTAKALLSLDNVISATISKCNFTGSSTTSQADGINIQCNAADTTACERVDIIDCNFSKLRAGVRTAGTVNYPFVNNSKFSNLLQGIVLDSDINGQSAVNGRFDKNIYNDIVNEAIAVGYSINRTSHTSSNSFFKRVGNGSDLTDITTSVQSAVIAFNSAGNCSINDNFQRDYEANHTDNVDFYYNSAVFGKATITNNATSTVEILSNTETPVVKIALTGADLMLVMQYQLTDSNLSRKGSLLINIAPDGYASMTDTFNYIEYIPYQPSGPQGPFGGTANIVPDIAFTTSEVYAASNNYVILGCNNPSTLTNSSLEFQINILS